MGAILFDCRYHIYYCSYFYYNKTGFLAHYDNNIIYKNLLLDPSGILPEYQPKTVIGLTKKGCI
jgi:hypothetical protein